MPLCSIVMPVHNGGTYLDAALKSIFAQTMHDFELIVINDGSTDNTADILTSFATDARLKVITNQKKQGIGLGLNSGIAAAATDLIVRIDGDDMMSPNRLERQVAYMRDNSSIGGAGSFYYIVDETGAVRGMHKWHLTSAAELERYLAGGGNPIFPHPTMIMRKSVIQSLGGYWEKKCEDVDLFCRMINAGFPILIQPEYLTYFRYHGTSASALNARIHFEINEVLLSNFRRHRAGLPPLSTEEFKANLARMSPPRKLYREMCFLSKICIRRRDMAKLRNRHVIASILLMGAAVCDLKTTYNKVWRHLSAILQRG